MNDQHAMPEPGSPDTGPTDDQLDALLGAFALDALEPDEHDAVDHYVRSNEAARTELARYEDVLAALASADAETAPLDLWDKVQSNLRPAAELERGPALASVGVGTPERHDAHPAPRTRRPARRWRTAALALAAALAILAGTVAALNRNGGGGTDLGELAQAAERADGSTVATLQGTAGTARLVVDRDGHGYLLAEGLQRLDAGRTYQLWSLDGDQPVSLGVLGARPTVVALPATDVRQVALSVEAAGGRAAPTLPPVAVGTVGAA